MTKLLRLFSVPNPIARKISAVVLLLLAPLMAMAGGTWTALNSGPPVGVNNCLLLGDGTVLGMNGAGQCVRLTPDASGSYINGTWTSLATMNNARLFFSSLVLTNGNVWVAGGEYGPGDTHSEFYTTLGDFWTEIPDPNPDPAFSDSISVLLPDGNPFVAPVSEFGGMLIYSVNSNSWQQAASANRGSQDEASWVKLSNDCILTIDAFSQNSEHYVPSQNVWIDDGTVPVQMYDSALGELGTGHLLPNGKAFYIGSTPNTAIYTPGTTPTSAGTWVAGPTMVFGLNSLGAPDAPAANLVNGKILCCLGPTATYDGPCSFYEYDYVSNAFTQVGAPGGGLTLGNTAPFGSSMLDLPDGTVLFLDGQNTGSLFVYTPDGSPLAAGQPVVNTISQNLNGSYHLTGTGLNGISQGASYGDDEQMDSNYPLVRMTNTTTGIVYYARTYNYGSTSVMTGSKVLTTEFAYPLNLPAGVYSLVAVANGIASSPVTVTNTPPPAPTGLAGTVANAQVSLSWSPVDGATAYNVKRLTTVGTPYFATIATVTTTNCTTSGLVNAYNYSYVVTAVAPGGESTNSSTLVIAPIGPPPVPSGVMAMATTFARIALSWNPSYAATNYTIERSKSATGPFTNLATTINPFYIDSGLVNGATFYYIISATSPEGTSAFSSPVSATAQAIVDFGFEYPVIGSGNDVYTPSGAFWNFSGGNVNFGSGLIANGSPFGNPNAPEGIQAAFIQSNGFISQVLSGFAPGSNYTITFAAAERSGNSQTWDVTVNGTVIASFAPGSGATSYSDYTATFTATNPVETLAFVGTDLSGGDNTVFIDNIHIAAGGFVTLPDFGFETPTVSGYQYNPGGGFWTFTGSSPNGSGIVANGGGFGNPTSPEGVQAAFVQEHGSVSQAVSNFVVGSNYQITFKAAERSGNSQTWNVTMNSAIIASYNPGSGATSYADYTANFTAVATRETLAFVGTDTPGGDNTIFIDDVVISPVLQPVSPTVTLLSPTNGGGVYYLTTLSLQASVAANGNSISNVQFFDDGTNLIGEVDNTPYNFAWAYPNSGTYSVFARVNYDGGSSADSTAAVITVVNTNVNFSFETPSIGSGNFRYVPTGASWVFGGTSGNGSGIVANGSGFSNPNATQGTQAAFVQGYGSFSQLLFGFTPGVRYTVTFSAAQRPGGSQHGGESWNLMVDTNVAGSFSPGSTSYTTYSANFVATSNSHTLAFVGTDLVGGDNTVFIDNVRISPTISQIPPAITLTSPVSNVVYSAANPVPLGATVTANGNTVVGVQFISNATNLIAQVTAPYVYSWQPATVGTSTVVARLVYDGSNTLDSAAVTITVTNPPPPVLQSISFGSGTGTLNILGSGLPNSVYYLSTATNLAPPVAWTIFLTNTSDASGNILFTNISPTNAAQYFLIAAP